MPSTPFYPVRDLFVLFSQKRAENRPPGGPYRGKLTLISELASNELSNIPVSRESDLPFSYSFLSSAMLITPTRAPRFQGGESQPSAL